MDSTQSCYHYLSLLLLLVVVVVVVLVLLLLLLILSVLLSSVKRLIFGTLRVAIKWQFNFSYWLFKTSLQVRAAYKYVAEDDDELSFEKGEIINVVEFDDPEEQVRCFE